MNNAARALPMLLTLLWSPLAASAQSPPLINYQGRLLNGTNLVNGNVGLALRLFSTASGGTALYEDTNTVAVVDGFYSTFLGDQTNSGNFLSALTNASVFLEAAVDGVTLSPRERLASSAYSLATRGLQLSTNSVVSVVLAGSGNVISNGVTGAALLGGLNNNIASQADQSGVVGGSGHRISTTGQRSTILGGLNHTIDLSATDNSLVAGFTNYVGLNSRASVIAGGQNNRIENNSFGGFIAGGASNSVAGRDSFAGGYRAKATNSGSFVWADGQDASFGSTSSNQFLVRAQGGMGVNTTTPVAGGLSVGGPLVANSIAGDGAGITNLGSAALADGSITGSKIASNSITGAQIADASLTAAALTTEPNPLLIRRISNPNFFATDMPLATISPVDRTRFALGFPRPNSAGGSAFLIDTDGSTIATLTHPTPDGGDVFGGAVAALGTTRVAVGAPFDDTSATDGGTVYLYSTAPGTEGNLLQTLLNPSASTAEHFGYALASVPVPGGSNRLVIGSPGEFGTPSAPNAGALFLYEETGAFVSFIANPNPVTNAAFGSTLLAVGTNRLAVAVPGHGVVASNQSRVVLYDLALGVTAIIENPTPQTNSAFGRTMTLLGTNTLVIGDPLYDSALLNEGRVYLFTLSGSLLLTITNPSPVAGDTFGASVAAVAPTRFLVGVPGDDSGAAGAGLAYLYDHSGQIVRVLTNSEPNAGDNLGDTVSALEGDTLLLTAPYDGILSSGAILLYSLNERVPGLRAEEIPERSVGELQLDMDFLDARYTHAAGDTMTGALTIATRGFFGAPLSLDNTTTGGQTWRITSQDNGSLAIWDDNAFEERARLSDTGLMLARAGLSTNAPEADLHVFRGSAGAVTANSTAPLVIENSTNAFLHLLTPTNAASGIIFGNPDNSLDASIRYNNFGNRDLLFRSAGNASRMIILSNGFVGINTTAPTNMLHVAGTVQATAYITASDRNAKENIAPVSPAQILDKVAALPISTWTFKEESSGTHIGPMAQDFHAAFGFGNTDSGIMTVDADGVALAAIQALAAENKRLREELDTIKRQLDL